MPCTVNSIVLPPLRRPLAPLQLILRTLNDAQSCFAAVHFKRGEDGGSLRLQRRFVGSLLWQNHCRT